MSNMNDQFEQMGYFRDALIRFNEQLNVSMRDLENHHELVSPDWQDDMRKAYDRQWQPLHEVMQRYLRRESHNYVEFLTIKQHSLGRYLHGG